MIFGHTQPWVSLSLFLLNLRIGRLLVRQATMVGGVSQWARPTITNLMKEGVRQVSP